MTSDIKEAVHLKASGYKWQCPNCHYCQGEPYAYGVVVCKRCDKVYEVTEHEHKFD